jgi:hypothetical protein
MGPWTAFLSLLARLDDLLQGRAGAVPKSDNFISSDASTAWGPDLSLVTYCVRFACAALTLALRVAITSAGSFELNIAVPATMTLLPVNVQRRNMPQGRPSLLCTMRAHLRVYMHRPY